MHEQASINTLSRSWLLLAVAAIGLSALFAVLLVVARTPLLQQLFDGGELFHTVLVLHVNFSVLIWLLSFGAVIWSLGIRTHHPIIDPLAIAMVIIGALLISLSPLLTPLPKPVMSNYIPVLQSTAFLTGLCAFSGGVGLYALHRLLARGEPAARLAAAATVVALLVFALTGARLPYPIESPDSFETLFWGGGHMLQFVYLLLLLACWERLEPMESRPLFGKGLVVVTLMLLGCGVVLALLFEPGSDAYRESFTQLMRFGTPLLILPPSFVLWRRGTGREVHLSLLLLVVGLLLGMLIRSDNVAVTAHYHATNSAITLAFMALAYRLFAEFGLGRPSEPWSKRQLQLYFAGMLVYIGGMALSGFLDVPRKVAMTAEGLQAVALGLMGLGGLIAISATLFFVVINLHALYTRQRIKLHESQSGHTGHH